MTTPRQTVQPIEKVPTGIPGFDAVAMGGLSRGRATLITGTAGSGKTIFATQFLVEAVRAGENVVFATFEESPADICRNVASMGWDISAWENAGRWAFVDASPQLGEESAIVGSFDLGALMARIEHAVRRIGASRISLDAITSIFGRFPDQASVRAELQRLVASIRQLGVTAVMTAERTSDNGEFSHPVEEFVADNVIVLRNTLEQEKRRRTIEILKFRGASHQRGEFPFTVRTEAGIVVIPLSAIELTQRSSDLRRLLLWGLAMVYRLGRSLK